MDTQEEGGNSYSHVDGNNRPRNPTKIRRDSIGSRSISNERPTRDTNASGRYDSTNWNHSDQGRAQPSDSDRRDIPEPQTTDGDTQAGYSRDATLWAPETLNRSLELSSRGCPGPVSVARDPEGRLRNGNANDWIWRLFRQLDRGQEAAFWGRRLQWKTRMQCAYQ